MDKLRIWKTPEHIEELSQKEVLLQIVHKRGKTTLKYAEAAEHSWYRNVSLATCFEGGLWVIGGMSAATLIASLIYSGDLEIDVSSILAEISAILGAGWGSKQIWRAINNRPAKERLITSETTYGPLVQAYIALDPSLGESESEEV